jgi:hypothetical protein
MGNMTVEMVYEDHQTFVTAWKVVWALFLAPGGDLLESLCNGEQQVPAALRGTESMRDPAPRRIHSASQSAYALRSRW